MFYIFWCSKVACAYIEKCLLNELFLLSVYNVHLCPLLHFLAWSLFCLIHVWLYLLIFGCHLFGVLSLSFSLLAYFCLYRKSLFFVEAFWYFSSVFQLRWFLLPCQRHQSFPLPYLICHESTSDIIFILEVVLEVSSRG